MGSSFKWRWPHLTDSLFLRATNDGLRLLWFFLAGPFSMDLRGWSVILPKFRPPGPVSMDVRGCCVGKLATPRISLCRTPKDLTPTAISSSCSMAARTLMSFFSLLKISWTVFFMTSSKQRPEGRNKWAMLFCFPRCLALIVQRFKCLVWKNKNFSNTQIKCKCVIYHIVCSIAHN